MQLSLFLHASLAEDQWVVSPEYRKICRLAQHAAASTWLWFAGCCALAQMLFGPISSRTTCLTRFKSHALMKLSSFVNSWLGQSACSAVFQRFFLSREPNPPQESTSKTLFFSSNSPQKKTPRPPLFVSWYSSVGKSIHVRFEALWLRLYNPAGNQTHQCTIIVRPEVWVAAPMIALIVIISPTFTIRFTVFFSMAPIHLGSRQSNVPLSCVLYASPPISIEDAKDNVCLCVRLSVCCQTFDIPL